MAPWHSGQVCQKQKAFPQSDSRVWQHVFPCPRRQHRQMRNRLVPTHEPEAFAKTHSPFARACVSKAFMRPETKPITRCPQAHPSSKWTKGSAPPTACESLRPVTFCSTAFLCSNRLPSRCAASKLQPPRTAAVQPTQLLGMHDSQLFPP